MAERLTEAPERYSRPRYPWDEWADGSWWAASWGRDFVCSLEGFRALVHETAKKRGGKAHTSVDIQKRIVHFQVEYPSETTDPSEVTT
jgi:hypothetical protein